MRRPTDVIGRFLGETAALVVVFGVLEEERLKWKGIRMKVEDLDWLERTVKALSGQPEEHTELKVLVGQVT